METYKCECGKVCATKAGLKSHKRFCKGLLDEKIEEVDQYINETPEEIIVEKPVEKSADELLLDEIKEYVANLQGRNRMTTAEAEQGIDLFTRKYGQSPGSPNCSACLKHLWKCLSKEAQ